MNQRADVTGRDDYLIAQALHRAIKALAALPQEHQPASDIEGMRQILVQRYRRFGAYFAAQDELRAALGESPERADAAELVARMPAWSEVYHRHWPCHRPHAGEETALVCLFPVEAAPPAAMPHESATDPADEERQLLISLRIRSEEMAPWFDEGTSLLTGVDTTECADTRAETTIHRQARR